MTTTPLPPQGVSTADETEVSDRDVKESGLKRRARIGLLKQPEHMRQELGRDAASGVGHR